MPSTLELALCRLHQRSYCVPVSSGTVGLTLTMKVLGVEGSGVAIPSGVCLSVPLSVHYADAVPVYCDIDQRTLGLSSTTLLNAPAPYTAVLAVHAYGNACDILTIEDHCHALGIPLIEDVAVAQGAFIDGRPAGSFGVASVVSFGHGKIIDVGGGGAVMTDDRVLAKEITLLNDRLTDRIDSDIQRLEAFSLLHTRLYNLHYGKDLNLHLDSFIKTAMALRDASLTRCAWNVDGVVMGLERLTKNLENRHWMVSQLIKCLEAKDIRGLSCCIPPSGSAPWRANLFISGFRNKVLRTLLAEGVKISSWYPPAQDFLTHNASWDTPVARNVGEQILNVWINDEVDIKYIDRVVGTIGACKS